MTPMGLFITVGSERYEVHTVIRMGTPKVAVNFSNEIITADTVSSLEGILKVRLRGTPITVWDGNLDDFFSPARITPDGDLYLDLCPCEKLNAGEWEKKWIVIPPEIYSQVLSMVLKQGNAQSKKEAKQRQKIASVLFEKIREMTPKNTPPT